MLQGNLVRKRKAGIKMAQDMLANGLHYDMERSLLSDVDCGDLMVGVQELSRLY
jgi:hypothetical protein